MRSLLLILLSPNLVLAAPPVASLFPAETVAYAELTKPPVVAKQINAWLQGSKLAAGVEGVHNRRDAITLPEKLTFHANTLSWFQYASPEFITDCGRMTAAAVAVLPGGKQPRIVCAILLGDSFALTLSCQSLLTKDPNIRRVALENGVSICQIRPTSTPSTGPDGIAKPLNAVAVTPGEGEWTAAYMPGLFVWGTDVPAVADVIKRFHGSIKTPTLAEDLGFMDARKTGETQDVFVYAKPEVYLAATKTDTNTIDPDWLAFLKLGFRPQTISRIFGGFTLSEDGWSATIQVDNKTKTFSPMVTLLQDANAKDGTTLTLEESAVVSLKLPLKGTRAKTVLEAWDCVAKARGVLGILPSERFNAKEKAAFEGVEAVTIRIRKDQQSFVLECETPAAASVFVETFPQIVTRTTNAAHANTPGKEIVDGITISTLSIDGGMVPSVAYANLGTTVIVSPKAKDIPALIKLPKPNLGATISLVKILELWEPPLKATSEVPFVALAGGLQAHNNQIHPPTLATTFYEMQPIQIGMKSYENRWVVNAKQLGWKENRVHMFDKLLEWAELNVNPQPSLPTLPGFHGWRGSTIIR